MFIFGKMSQTAIAVVSRLAEEFSANPTLLSSETIAQDQSVSQALVGKILTILAKHRIVHGVRGPRGGYRLIHEPKKTSLYDIVSLFERNDEKATCPLGANWSGNHRPCGFHAEYRKLSKYNIDFLKEHHFGGLVANE